MVAGGSSFVEGLNRRASSTNTQVEAVQSMSIDTISFRELLGHCNHLYNHNQTQIDVIQDHFKQYGYQPAEFDDSSDQHWPNSLGPGTVAELQDIVNPAQTDMSASSYLSFTSTSARNCSNNVLPDDPMFEDSLSLQDLGLSDACLATLAREDAGNFSEICDLPIQRSQESKYQDKELPPEHLYDSDVLLNSNGLTESHESTSENLDQIGAIIDRPIGDCLLKAGREDYDRTPSWLRGLASWEELEDAISKINKLFFERAKEGVRKDLQLLDQVDLETLGFGKKAKPFLLLLVRINCLTIEHQAGGTVYRVNVR